MNILYIFLVRMREKLQAACYVAPAFEFAFWTFNFFSLFVRHCFFTVNLWSPALSNEVVLQSFCVFGTGIVLTAVSGKEGGLPFQWIADGVILVTSQLNNSSVAQMLNCLPLDSVHIFCLERSRVSCCCPVHPSLCKPNICLQHHTHQHLQASN